MLEKKEKMLEKKADSEVERAKQFIKANNKRAAMQCLKKKKLYDVQIQQIRNFQLRVQDQMVLLEGAKATTDTVDALRTGAAAIKKMQQEMNIDDVDKTMGEIHDQVDDLRQIQEALSAPLGVADFDEDELEEELLALEDDDRVEEKLQEQILRPVTVSTSQPVDHARQPASPSSRLLAVSQETKEKEELDELIAEMAI
ncbi:vacuolar protein sorting-associated protein 32 homolog 1-like [Nymphaea colorata]|nr:vacuolar protein sorting-associated protein 32 homolog 1-like [Nymphaea colorata]